MTPTAGGVVNTATSTVGGVANAAMNTVGGEANTAGSTVGSIGRIQVALSTDASAIGGSTLSLNGGNLKLEKGTTFNVALSSRATAGN